MSLHLTLPKTPLESLKAQAASGASGVSKRAQAELKQRVHAALAKAAGK